MNHCLGQELRLEAESLATSPRSRAVRDALLDEAGRRFQSSAVEASFALGFVGDMCSLDPAARGGYAHLEPECNRLRSTSYADHVLRTVAESVSSLGEIHETLVESAARAGDALSPARFTSPEALSDAIWGPEGYRFEAAQRLMGRAEGVVAYGRSDSTFGTRRMRNDWDGAYASETDGNGRAAETLGLLVAHRVPFGASRQTTGRVDFTRLQMTGPDADRRFRALFNLLDHRMAAAEQTGPYALTRVPDELLVGDGPMPSLPGADLRNFAPMSESELLSYATRPLPPLDSPLRRRHGLGVDDVRAAHRLAKGILATQDVRYEVVEQVPGSAPLLGFSRFDVFPAADERLAFALQNVGGPTAAIAADPLGVVLPPSASGAEVGFSNVYGLDVSRTRDVGAALALHLVRVHLRRAASTWLFDVSSREEAASVDAVTSLVDAFVGSHWTEYTRYQEITCATPARPSGARPSPGAGYFCASPASVSGRWLDRIDGQAPGRWTLYHPPGDALFDADALEPVIVRGAFAAECLRLGTDPSCPSDPESLPGYAVLQRDLSAPPAGRPSVEAVLGVRQRRYLVTTAHTFAIPSAASTANATGYVFWRHSGRSDDDGEMADDRRGSSTIEHILVDVIQPLRRGSVHALGGRYAELFANAVAKQPLNPVRPAVASIGLPYDLVPPLESELTSTGDAYERSYQHYLANAARAAETARTSLDQARRAELEALRDGRADIALLEEARLAEQETLLTTCGSERGCEVPRARDVRLGEVYVDGRPLIRAPAADEIPFFVGIDGASGQPLVRVRDALGFVDRRCDHVIATVLGGASFEGIDKRDYDDFVERSFSGALGCLRHALLHSAMDARMHEVPERVIEELAVGGSGQFPTLRGEVREPLVAAFQGMMDLHSALEGFESQYQIALAEIRRGARQIDDLMPSQARERWCKAGRILAVIGTIAASVVSTIVTFGAASAVIVAIVVVASVASSAAAASGLVELDKCGGNEELARATIESTLSGALLAMENLRGITDEVRRTSGRLALGNSRLDQLATRARIARARRDIQERLIATNSLSDMPEWRALQTAQARRARRQLYRAQQYAFVARRAVELRLAVDLPSLTRAEPFTEAPTLWANDVFTVDTASSADGRAGAPATGHASTAGEAIVDYVERLSDFVRGYPFARRFRDASDVQVLSLAALADEGPVRAENRRSFHELLAYVCNDDSMEVAPQEAAPCAQAGGVAYAEVRFSVPRFWGDYLADRLATEGFNHRHERVALNLVGGGLVDCRRSSRPTECWSNGNLRYDLRQEGSVLLESYERDLHRVEMEPGVIVAGRALAAERVLTNPISGADRSLLSGYERAELWGRPLMGTYTVRIHGRPEIVWERLQDVQVLLQYRFWTRQE
ncbi:MAG: hypothetical protein KF901_19460 [Myxococcales bacterium]|nr:hypothetical protein [Myxococcales bacterium]